MFAVHLLEAAQEVIGFGKGEKSVAFGFACSSVSDDSGHLERGVSSEYTCKDLVVDLVT